MKEKYIETKIKKYLESKGCYVRKQFGTTCTKAGTPDLLCCYKGKFIAIEVKNEVGKTSKLQDINLQQIKQSGGISFVARSVEEVQKVIDTIT